MVPVQMLLLQEVGRKDVLDLRSHSQRLSRAVSAAAVQAASPVGKVQPHHDGSAERRGSDYRQIPEVNHNGSNRCH